ncbi:MAG: hypothetical protein ACTSQF_13850 [Candidatus Heimdallarchaeaceae archaeon]
MRKKLGIIAGLIVLTILSRSVSGATSFHVPGTMIHDTVYGTYNAIIEEGYYFLVFDNTGYLTDNFNRNHSYVIYFLEFAVEGIDPIAGQGNVSVDDYTIVPFNFEVPEVYISHITFEMYTSQPISSFICDYEGLALYFEFIGQIDVENQRITLIIVSSVSGGIIILLAVNILLVRNRVYFNLRRRYRAYRNKKAGRRFKNIG